MRTIFAMWEFQVVNAIRYFFIIYALYHQSLIKELFSNIEIIPQTEEKFMSFKIHQKLKFVDSMLFLQAGLEKVENQ